MEFTPDTTVNKLTLLFILDKMEIPLTENNLIDICTSRNNWLNYMELQEILHQLLDVGFIFKNSDSDAERYGLTYEGRNCLSHFFTRIPQSLREDITEFSKDNRLIVKRNQEYLADYHKNADGSHSVILKIKEPLVDRPLLEIKIKAPTRHSAILACKKWKDQAPSVFEMIYDTFIDLEE